MMIHAYQEIYLNKAQSVMGDMLDYAVNVCGLSGRDYIQMFVVSTISKRMENGEPAFLVGKSGIEVLQEVVLETMSHELQIEVQPRYSRSAEYWVGWAAAYYQWYSGIRYEDIFRVLSFDELKKMYYMLHEADIMKFVEIADSRMKSYFSDTRLKCIRMFYEYTQKELSERSGVSLRSIQMYEQRNKDINKASAETIYRLSKALGCNMEDLIEK